MRIAMQTKPASALVVHTLLGAKKKKSMSGAIYSLAPDRLTLRANAEGGDAGRGMITKDLNSWAGRGRCPTDGVGWVGGLRWGGSRGEPPTVTETRWSIAGPSLSRPAHLSLHVKFDAVATGRSRLSHIPLNSNMFPDTGSRKKKWKESPPKTLHSRICRLNKAPPTLRRSLITDDNDDH